MAIVSIPITLREANAFVKEFHRHSAPTQGGRFAIGATDGDGLHGIAIVGRPLSRMLQDGWTAELTRCCVKPDAPKGTPSFLYGRCWRIWQMMGGLRMVTYTLASENGASLRGVGWRIIGEVKPSAGWGRKDRQRQWKSISAEPKLRWEAQA